MSESNQQTDQNNSQKRVIELSVNGHLMSLDKGLYCIYHAPDQMEVDNFGFPGVRISLPPFKQSANVRIETFEDDGWIGGEKSAALIRVSGGPGLILVTVYLNPGHEQVSPKLQVVRLNDAPEDITVEQVHGLPQGASQQVVAPQSNNQSPAPSSVKDEAKTDMKIFAHAQRQGDVTVPFGEWIGIPDSKAWIEGFGLSVGKELSSDDIEYQAVLGKGWLSPWYKGDQFCGSRGMSLPLCGLRVRLSENAAKKYRMQLSATFIDGTKLGPVDDDTTLSSETVAPLEAINFQLLPKDSKSSAKVTTSKGKAEEAAKPVRKTASRTNVKVKTTAREAVTKAAASKTNKK